MHSQRAGEAAGIISRWLARGSAGQPMHKLLGVALALLVVLTGCGTQSTQVLGEAYVAPASLNLRPELTQKSSVAVLKYGERVSIVDVRRRYVKVRTTNGAEGWVDSFQLLSPEQMDQIRRENQQALALPSEGAATVFESLNIHLEPS